MSENVIYIPGRIKNAADGGHVAGADDIIDDLKGKTQNQINSEVDTKFGQHDSKFDEEDTKINALEAGNFVTLEATDADTTIADVFTRLSIIPATNVVYRIANWKHNDATTKYNIAYYSEYAANGNTTADLVPISVENKGIDDEPNPDSENLVKSGGVANMYGSYKENTEFIYVLCDSQNRIILAIKSDFTVYYGAGIPQQVKDYIDEKLSPIILTQINDVISFIGDLISGDDLATLLEGKVDVVVGKGLSTNDYTDEAKEIVDIHSFEDNASFVDVVTDSEGKILMGILANGDIFFGYGIPSQIREAIKNVIPYDYQEVLDFLGDYIGGQDDLETILNSIKITNDERYKLTNIDVLPSYYHSNDYIDNKIVRINDVFMNAVRSWTEIVDGQEVVRYANANTFIDSFAFFSDAHYYASGLKSGVILEYLLKKSIVKKIFYGGDTNSVNTSYNSLYSEVNENNLVASRVRAYGKYFPMMGNHDNYNSYYPEGDEQTTTVRYPLRATVSSILDQCNVDSIVLNEDDVWSYYYYDEKFSKIRYIVINMFNISNRVQMMTFIINALLDTPDGYDNILFGHTGVAYNVCVPEEYGNSSSYFGQIRTLISAFQNNENNYVYSGQSYDFSNVKNKIIAFISGHVHEDGQNYYDGTAYISILNSAAYYGKSKSAMYTYHEYPSRTKGTINEDCIDVMTCSREKDENGNIVDGFIDCTRIGAGFNRKFYLKKNTLTLGETLQLTSEFESVANWLIHDSTEATKDTSVAYGTEVWQFTNNIATISATGLVTSLSVGDCYAIAINSDGDKEFFYIKVINN